MPSVSDTISIIEVSSGLANNDVSRAALFRKKTNPRLPVILYSIAKVLRKVNTDDGSYEDLQKVADYGYFLCAPYQALASSIVGSSPGGTVSSPTSSSTTGFGRYLIPITSDDFANATDYNNTEIVGKSLEIYDNNNQVWLTAPTQWTYTDDGVRFVGIDTTTESRSYKIFILNPTADTGQARDNDVEIITITAESSKTISWTSGRRLRFGTFPSIEVWLLDNETNVYQKTSIQPTIDAPPPNFTTMTFQFGGSVTGFILIK